MSLGKITALVERSQQFHANLEADCDARMARYDALEKKKQTGLAKFDGYLDLVDKDLDASERAITQLTNLPLTGSNGSGEPPKE